MHDGLAHLAGETIHLIHFEEKGEVAELVKHDACQWERENALIIPLYDFDDPFKSIDFTKDVSEWHNEPILTNFFPSRKGAIFDVLALKMGEIGASTATLTPGFTKKLDELIAALRNSSG